MTPWLGRLALILIFFAAGWAGAAWLGYGDWGWGIGTATAVIGALFVQIFIWKPKRPS